jgi:hypothetical protein
MQMRTAIVAAGVLAAGLAVAAPKLPVSPGNPPQLAGVPTAALTLMRKGRAIPLEVWIEGRETWKIQLSGKETRATIALPKLAVGTTRGGKATLGTGVEAGRVGPWVVEMTAVSVGYLKGPGGCSGKIAAWFAKDVYIVGTFENAGCISYTPPP